jgi:hypothetical protein
VTRWDDLPAEKEPSPSLSSEVNAAAGLDKSNARYFSGLAARVLTAGEHVRATFAAGRVRFNEVDGSHQTAGGKKADPAVWGIVTTERVLFFYDFGRGFLKKRQSQYAEFSLSSIKSVSELHMGKFQLQCSDGRSVQLVFDLWAVPSIKNRIAAAHVILVNSLSPA